MWKFQTKKRISHFDAPRISLLLLLFKRPELLMFLSFPPSATFLNQIFLLFVHFTHRFHLFLVFWPIFGLFVWNFNFFFSIIIIIIDDDHHQFDNPQWYSTAGFKKTFPVWFHWHSNWRKKKLKNTVIISTNSLKNQEYWMKIAFFSSSFSFLLSPSLLYSITHSPKSTWEIFSGKIFPGKFLKIPL